MDRFVKQMNSFSAARQSGCSSVRSAASLPLSKGIVPAMSSFFACSVSEYAGGPRRDPGDPGSDRIGFPRAAEGLTDGANSVPSFRQDRFYRKETNFAKKEK